MLTKTLVFFVLFTSFQVAQAAEYTLSVQPMLKPSKAKVLFKPLADYLSAKTGETITIKTYRTFTSYWHSMKRGKGFDMALDAAHFVDYRIKNSKHRVLAKLPDTVTFTLATRQDLFLLDTEELVSYKVAVIYGPGVGSLRLRQMFPDPADRPMIVPVLDIDAAVAKINKGSADAVIFPTPLTARFPELNVMLTTEPMPHQGFTVSPKVPDKVAKKISEALLGASKTNGGRKMLLAINAIEFVPASNKIYDGSSKLLEVMKKP